MGYHSCKPSEPGNEHQLLNILKWDPDDYIVSVHCVKAHGKDDYPSTLYYFTSFEEAQKFAATMPVCGAVQTPQHDTLLHYDGLYFTLTAVQPERVCKTSLDAERNEIIKRLSARERNILGV